MIKKTVIIAASLLVSSCANSKLYNGVLDEAKNYRTPIPKPTEYFPTQPQFPSWTDADNEYRFYPGDEIEINVPSAPELNRTTVVAPDGRISLNLVGSVMAADRSVSELTKNVENAYYKELKNNNVVILPKAFASQKIYVGGEVQRPGIYEINGEIDPLQAIILAGGFLNSARRDDVVVLRRGAGGQPFMRTFDLKNSFAKDNAFANMPRLRRFDIIWVPKSAISEVGLFTQQFLKDALPVTFSFSYSLNSKGNIF